MSSRLFSQFKIRDTVFRNRIFVSPMCMYSCVDGFANDWHMVHLGSRATGGAALVMAEATAVSPIGRISPGDLGIWSDAQADALKPICKFIKSQSAVPAIQLAHAGRKAGTDIPWGGGAPLTQKNGGWSIVAPSAIAFAEGYQTPAELNKIELFEIAEQFLSAAQRSLAAGFEVIEIHMAHGYLLNEFLSPLANQRKDEYGGSLENRMRYPLQVAKSLRDFWPAQKPVFVRISATDWAQGGWDIEQSLVFCSELKKNGIDLIDCSSGGMVPYAKVPISPGYQVPFADVIRKKVGILTGAVGLITEAMQAENILQQDQADAVFLARELLRDPYWPLHAAQKLNEPVEWPVQYLRARPQMN